jgi:hypothetical protein
MKNSLYLLFFITTLSNAQVGIGTTTPAGALDLNPTVATNFGLVTPRVALTSILVEAPVVNPQGGAIPTGTVVYNTATAGTSPNNVGPGLYFWNGVRWVSFEGSPGGLDWSLTGNTGTVATTNFIGTSDAIDFVTRTNNLERTRILSNGHVLINTTTNDATSGADNIFEVIATTVGDDAINGYANGAGSIGVSGYSTLTGSGTRGENTGTGIGVRGVNSNTTASQGGTGVLGDITASTTTTGTGVKGQADSLTGSGMVALNVNGGNGIYAQSTGATNTSSAGAVYASLSQAAAGNQDVAGVIGIQSNIRQGTGGYAGPLVAAANSSLSGVSGTFASKEIVTTDAYFFGVIGDVLRDSSIGSSTIPNRSGGVMGFSGTTGTFGILGYKNSAGTLFGTYSSAAPGTGTGRMASAGQNNGIGIGANGGFMGGYIKGQQYGLVSQGEEFGMYVNGNTITNAPIVQLTENGNKRTATYATTSTSVDVTTRGKAKLTNGETFVAFNQAFIESVSSSELDKNIESNDAINITITPVGESNGVFIKSITSRGFYVKENARGTSNVSFNWTAIGTKKGYENGVTISSEILANDFDTKMEGVMHNEADTKTSGSPIYYDGNKVRFEKMSEDRSKMAASIPVKKMEATTIENEKPKTK